MIEQNEQEIEQMTSFIEQDIDLKINQLNLPDVVQQNEVQ